MFAGSGSIFFNKDKAEKNILNDLDKETANSFNLIKQAPLDINSYPNPNTISTAKRFFSKPIGDRIQDKIAHYKIKVSSGFRSKPVIREAGIYRSINIRNWLKPLPEWKEKLKGTIITNLDYEKVVKKYDSNDTFFFIDPPYENTSKSFGYAESSEFDFDRLLNVLEKIKGSFLMSINDSPYIRKLFKNFIIRKVDVRNFWVDKTDETQSMLRKELLIMNYTP